MTSRAVLDSLSGLLPEVAVAAAMAVTLLLDLTKRRSGRWIALVGLAAAGALAIWTGLRFRPAAIFQGAAALDAWGLYWRTLLPAIGIATVLLARSESGEFHALLLAAVLGLMLLSCAGDLLVLLLSMELAGLAGVGLLGRRPEAAMKLILFGAAATAMTALGAGYFYGIAGSIEIREIGRRLGELNAAAGTRVPQTLLATAGALFLAGFAFRLAAVPFHAWRADVGEGAPVPVSAFLCVAVPAAALAALGRFVHYVGGPDWRILLAVLGGGSMLLGTLACLTQRSLKRLFACGALANTGWLVLAAGDPAALAFGTAAYAVTTFGAFAVVQALEERGIATVDGCAGAGRGFAGVSAILFLGLAGVPPTVGFAGRFAVLGGLARSGRLGLALAACVAACAALSFYYYGRILTRMLRAGGGAARAPVAWAAAGLTLLLGVFWSPLFDLARSCAAGMLPP